MSQPQINGQEFEWSSIRVKMLGNTREILGLTEVNFDAESDNQWHNGVGRHAVAFTMGPKKYSGSLKFHKGEISALERALPVGTDLLDLKPFDIVVSYKAGTNVVVKTLVGCLLTKQSESNNTGTRLIENSLSFTFVTIA